MPQGRVRVGLPQLVHSVNRPAPISANFRSDALFHLCFTTKLLIFKNLMLWRFFVQIDAEAAVTALRAWSTRLMHRLIHNLCG
ncbi:hypothetical protein STPYR_12065 [uncultured Stenotrophomonas sp.]|uniref:Uncharacterized protein n=1 Tax=uncultured Stenotrophomonas sp. TaxID=165438 RepID=A0A1Y5Q861_9GAMM|nr:hypothetical protein STPYR_12065 [uncultured Stenotrophomonas sp.]